MKQLTQQLKSGRMEISEVPFPALNEGEIMVRNHYSVISPGTEGKTVSDARKGYIKKAKSRKKEVKLAIEMIKEKGFFSTYKLVMNKLEAPSSLGYSTIGEVITLASDVTSFQIGDLVACGGNSAVHADVITVPINLAVKVPTEVDVKQAAFTTIASIAIQGIRQANLKMGENCLIIGMGIVGQLTYKILESSAIDAIGIDICDSQLEMCKKFGIKNVYNRNHNGLDKIIEEFTDGYGFDSVIISATSKSLDPIEYAGQAVRKKGKVIIVGQVPTGFSRNNYYKKEIDLRMSSSYGPGRYDTAYEVKGQDYPINYVRWTENRNMKSFIKLLSSGRLNISSLITHTFMIEDSINAYDMIVDKKELFCGILIKYNPNVKIKRNIKISEKKYFPDNINVGLIGAGSFAQNILLPIMKGNCCFVGIMSGKGNNAKYVGDKYGFSYLYSDSKEIFTNKDINTVFVLTRHNLHSKYVIDSIKNNKNIFVEKPLAITENELLSIKSEYEKNKFKKHLMVGFNRRFSPAVVELKKRLIGNNNRSISIRVNAGNLPKEHWVNDKDIGGGRIIGEVCHFVDLAIFLSDSKVVSISSESMQDSSETNNTLIVNLKMKNGNIASINYFSNGNNCIPKEFIEVFSNGLIMQIDDFKELRIFNKAKKIIKYSNQDKGHVNCIKSMLSCISNGTNTPISFNDIFFSSLCTFKVLESLRENKKILI